MNRASGFLVAAVLLTATAGCPPPTGRQVERTSPSPPAPVDDANVMRVEVNPVAVSWDDRPGPDGLDVRVHFFRPGSSLPVAVNGTLEFVLYEGLVAEDDLPGASAFYRWEFATERLGGNLVRSAIGWGYVLRLAWTESAPRTSSVTLVARYRPPSGPPVRDKPVAIAVGPR